MTTPTTKIVAAFKQSIRKPLHLSGKFTTTQASYFNTEEIEYHVARSEEDVAVPMANQGLGYHVNDEASFTKKTVIPPTYREEIAIAASTVGRTQSFGMNPYQDQGFIAEATSRAMYAAELLSGKIARANELQASQVFTTGKLALKDADGNTVYSLDYKPKSAHFFTTAADWDTPASSDPVGDIQAACDLIRKNGKVQARYVEMSTTAFEQAFANANFKAHLDTLRADLGAIYPANVGTDSVYMGTFTIGANKLDIYCYDGWYRDPSTGTITAYLPSDKVVVHAGSEYLNTAFGSMFNFNQIQAPIPSLRGRLSVPELGFDLFVNNWVDPNGETLHIGVGARALMIPTLLDSIVCIDTKA